MVCLILDLPLTGAKVTKNERSTKLNANYLFTESKFLLRASREMLNSRIALGCKIKLSLTPFLIGLQSLGQWIAIKQGSIKPVLYVIVFVHVSHWGRSLCNTEFISFLAVY